MSHLDFSRVDKVLLEREYPLLERLGLRTSADPEDHEFTGLEILSDQEIAAGESLLEGEEATPENQALDGTLAAYLRSLVPTARDGFRHSRDLIRQIVAWWSNTSSFDVLALIGPTGSGKTSACEQFCFAFGIPLLSLKGHKLFDPSEAFGHFVLGENGNTVWINGPVTLAAILGLPVLINEFDRIPAGRAIIFNDVFEGRPFPVPGKPGQIVHPRPGFRVVITGNTNMVEDLTGNYEMSESDKSVLERLFAVRVDYMTEDEEKAVVLGDLAKFDPDVVCYFCDTENLEVNSGSGLKKGAAITLDELATAFVKTANAIRKQSADCNPDNPSGTERTMSTRTLRRWVEYAIRYAPLAERAAKSALLSSLDNVLTLCATETTRLVIRQAVEANFGAGPGLIQNGGG